MGDMKNIGTAIESYITDMAMAPGGGSVTYIEDLSGDLEPFYIKQLPDRDAWNWRLRYQSGVSGLRQSYYSIISYGRDGVDSGINIANTNYLINSLSGFNNDICFSDGIFTYAPKIK
jgi:hypothetical protein